MSDCDMMRGSGGNVGPDEEQRLGHVRSNSCCLGVRQPCNSNVSICHFSNTEDWNQHLTLYNFYVGVNKQKGRQRKIWRIQLENTSCQFVAKVSTTSNPHSNRISNLCLTLITHKDPDENQHFKIPVCSNFNTPHNCPLGFALVSKIKSTIIIIKVNSYLWFGDEGPSRDGEAVVNGAEILSHDGQTAPLFAACAGRQPLDGWRRQIRPGVLLRSYDGYILYKDKT